MADLDRIKQNVAKMASMNAPEEDIDGYIASEGVSLDDVKNHQIGAEKQDTSIARTIFDQAGQGLTFGFMDEGQDLLGALGAKAYDKLSGENVLPSLTETIKQARKDTQDRLSQQLEQNPGTSILSNMAGSLVTGGAIGSTAAGKAVSDALRTGGLGARALKSVAPAAIAGGLTGLGTGNDSLDDRLQSARGGYVLGAVAGPVAATLSAGVNKLVGSPEKTLPTAEELRKSASGMYKSATEKGGLLRPEFTDQFVEKIQGMKPQTEIGQAIFGDSDFTKFVDKLKSIKGKPISLDAAQEFDEHLGDMIDNFSENGKLTKEGKKLLDIQTTFRKMINDADETMTVGGKDGFNALKQARAMWSDSRKLNDIERIINRGEDYDNAATVIKNGFRTLANNPERMKGYSAAEKAAIKKAAQSGIVGDTLRTLAGSRLLSTMIGVHAGGLGGAAAGAVASAGSRSAAEALQLSRAAKIAEAIAGKYASTNTQQPALRALSSYLPNAGQTVGVLPSNTALLSKAILQPK